MLMDRLKSVPRFHLDVVAMKITGGIAWRVIERVSEDGLHYTQYGTGRRAPNRRRGVDSSDSWQLNCYHAPQGKSAHCHVIFAPPRSRRLRRAALQSRASAD